MNNRGQIGFESGGGSGSASGGANVFSGNVNPGGSHGSHLPMPSYFEEQHSLNS